MLPNFETTKTGDQVEALGRVSVSLMVAYEEESVAEIVEGDIYRLPLGNIKKIPKYPKSHKENLLNKSEPISTPSIYPALIYVKSNGAIFMEMADTRNITYGHNIIKQHAKENGKYLSLRKLYPELPVFSRVFSGTLTTLPHAQSGPRGVFSFDSIHSTPIPESVPIFRALLAKNILSFNSSGQPLELVH